MGWRGRERRPGGWPLRQAVERLNWFSFSSYPRAREAEIITLQQHKYSTSGRRGDTEAPSLALFYVLFGSTGVATALLGVLLPAMGARLSLGDADAGRLLALQFTGQLLGALLVGRRVRRALLGGLIATVIAAGCLIGAADLMQELLFCYGLGLGVVMTATNIIVGLEAIGSQRASRLELLNTFWPMGAAVCPWVALSLQSKAHPMLPYGALSAVFFVLFGLLLLRPRYSEGARSVEEASQQTSMLRLIFSCLLALLAVGVESGVAGWLTTFGSRYLKTTQAVPWLPTLFWCGLLLGRFNASRALLSVRPAALGVLSAVCAVLTAGLLAVSYDGVAMAAAAFCCAFCVGPLYPMVLARSVHLRGKNLVFFSAGVGSALVPWMVGRASVWSGSLRQAMMVPASAALLLLVVLAFDGRTSGAFGESRTVVTTAE